MNSKKFITVVVFITIICKVNFAQQKVVNQQFQVWVSSNNLVKLNSKWGVIADVHLRRNNGLSDPSFLFLRGGLQYHINPKVSAAFGYGHNWIAPTIEGYSNTINEDRLYQQISLSDNFLGSDLLLRLRNEQRKTQVMVFDTFTGNYTYINRVRILVNFLIPISKETNKPKLLIAEEFLFNLGKDALLNTFNQNRLTIGFRKKLSKNWSYDFGYMMVYQQKASGFNYDLNHTLRLFFYGNFDPKNKD